MEEENGSKQGLCLHSTQAKVHTVIRKIFGGKIFLDGQGHPKFIYLKILQYEYLLLLFGRFSQVQPRPH